ncbi:MAG: HAMP domain-containing histidine kinase [Lachnospiraceae bacterium]|nr:HAMP domain-containing histidine kinase [Lachnospiraceae bacterium]
MLYVLIFILIALVLLLFLKLQLIRKEMRRISSEMKDNKDGRNMNLDFVDADLQEMTAEVNRLYGQMMRIKAESREDEEKLRRSVSMISHDMKTPLTSIIGYLQIAERTDDEKEKADNIGVALERARYLNGLINDFFELSLVESGQVDKKIERLNICEMICEEILAESPEIDKKGIEPVFGQADKNIYVHTDRKMLTRVLQNLTSNAVKYSDGRLEYRIEENKAEKTTVISIISSTADKIDTGRIFDRFYKEDSSRSKGGAGLGLYIVKCFTEAMGGHVSASQDGELFTVTLELKDAEEQIPSGK